MVDRRPLRGPDRAGDGHVGVFVAPRGAAGWPLAFVLLGAALVVWIVLGNVPGLGDGIKPQSWPLAIWLGISGLYTAFVSIACVIRARNPASNADGR